MKKRRYRFLLSLAVLIAVCLTGCVKNEFAVEFSLPEKIDNTYKVLYYASDPAKGWIVESVAQLQKGKAEFKGITRNPTIVYIFSGGREPVLFFYAERGDHIKISGEGSDPLKWIVGGNKINEELTAWRKANAKVLEKTAGSSGGSAAELNRAVAGYVSEHPGNPVSALLLLEYYDRREDEEGYRKCWHMLRDEATDGKWRELVSRSDMLEEPGKGGLPRRIVLNTVGTGCDTITPGRVPVLMYFSRSSVDGYRETARELRKLAMESGDSSSRVIANVLFEPDSMVRWQNARYDSLRNVVDAWVPLGISDQQMRELGVPRIPYVLVLDKGGKPVYRGDDLKEASEEFSKLLR